MSEKIAGYDVKEELRSDPMRSWLLASREAEEVVLYVVRPRVQLTESLRLTGQLKSVEALGDARLIASTRTRKPPDAGYAVIYDLSLAPLLRCPLERSKADAVEAGLQTLTLLQILHRADITIGHFMPESILWEGGKVRLFDFTFDAILRENVANVVQQGTEKLAPELRDGARKPTPRTDLWSLATYLGRLDPRIAASRWHARCISADPKLRPESAEEAVALLRRELPDVSDIRSAGAPVPATEPAIEEDIGIRSGPEASPPPTATEAAPHATVTEPPVPPVSPGAYATTTATSTPSTASETVVPEKTLNQKIDEHMAQAQAMRFKIAMINVGGGVFLLLLSLLAYFLMRGRVF